MSGNVMNLYPHSLLPLSLSFHLMQICSTESKFARRHASRHPHGSNFGGHTRSTTMAVRCLLKGCWVGEQNGVKWKGRVSCGLNRHASLWCQHLMLTIIFFHSRLPFAQIHRRVHISEKTLSFLNGEFEVEPAYGEKREEALRIAGLKTYFITKVLKPVRDCLLNIKSLVVVCVKLSARSYCKENFQSQVKALGEAFLIIVRSIPLRSEREDCLFTNVCLYIWLWNLFGSGCALGWLSISFQSWNLLPPEKSTRK